MDTQHSICKHFGLIFFKKEFSGTALGLVCRSPWALHRQAGQYLDELHCKNFSTFSKKSDDVA